MKNSALKLRPGMESGSWVDFCGSHPAFSIAWMAMCEAAHGMTSEPRGSTATCPRTHGSALHPSDVARIIKRVVEKSSAGARKCASSASPLRAAQLAGNDRPPVLPAITQAGGSEKWFRHRVCTDK